MTPVIASLIGALIAAVVGLITVWIKDKRDYSNAILMANDKLIDQLQEERVSIKSDVSTLKHQVAGLLLQARYKDDYINVLRSHIEHKRDPPPPGYPPELLRIGSEGL